MEIAGIVISIIALFLSLFTYIKHDVRIKQQAAKLNEYQLDKIEIEKQEEIQAIIEANVINGDRGKRTIKVYNKGKSTARQVDVIIPKIEGYQVVANPCPIDIRPQNRIDISLITFNGAPDKIILNLIGKMNFEMIILTLKLFKFKKKNPVGSKSYM